MEAQLWCFKEPRYVVFLLVLGQSYSTPGAHPSMVLGPALGYRRAPYVAKQGTLVVRLVQNRFPKVSCRLNQVCVACV